MASKYGSIIVFWNPETSEKLAEVFADLGETYGGMKPIHTATLTTETDHLYPLDAPSLTLMAATNARHPKRAGARQFPTLCADEPHKAASAYRAAISGLGIECVVSDLRDKEHPDIPAGEAFCIEFEDIRLTIYPTDLSRLAQGASAIPAG